MAFFIALEMSEGRVLYGPRSSQKILEVTDLRWLFSCIPMKKIVRDLIIFFCSFERAPQGDRWVTCHPRRMMGKDKSEGLDR